MKYKVSELEGALLDSAVALAAGVRGRIVQQEETSLMLRAGAEFRRMEFGDLHFEAWRQWSPSTDWGIGGPLIEAARMAIAIDYGDTNLWWAGWECIDEQRGEQGLYWQSGPTLLIAAMRAYVANRLGCDIDFP